MVTSLVRVGSLPRAVVPTALLKVLLAAGVVCTCASASLGDASLESTGADAEIRIGNVVPYTGELAAFGAMGKAESDYFDMIDDAGGINGRKVRFLSYDSGSDPVEMVNLTRRLVEADKVLLPFASFGTLGNLAVRGYLNERQIPQLFVASGDDEWAHPERFPWTMGWPPAFRTEGWIYANYIQAYYPGKKIAVLWQRDEFGRDLYRGLEDGFGDSSSLIVSDITFDLTDKSLDTQIDVLRNSGAEILVFDGAPAMAARAIRHLADIDWHPVFLLDNASASIANALRPAGLENSTGVVSTVYLKDASDPAWADDADMKAFLSFMYRYYPEGDKDDSYAIFGYAVAHALTEVLKRCGDDLSRSCVSRQAQSLRNLHIPVMLPSIVVNISPTDYHPIKQMRLVQFDGRSWQPIGDVIDSAFVGSNVR